MKTLIPLTSLSVLLFFGTAAALPQEAVSIEKKRAMNKFDPVDVFPEAKEHGRKDRKKREKNSAEPAALASSEPIAESAQPSRQRLRHRRSKTSNTKNSDVGLVAGLAPAPTPAIGVTAEPRPSPAMMAQTTGAASATPLPGTISPNTTMSGTAAQSEPSPQSLVAVDHSSTSIIASSSTSSPSLNIPPSQPKLSLPVILSLISVILLLLAIAFAKLMKQVRGSAN